MSDLISRQDTLNAIQKRADEVDSVYSAFWEGLKIAQDIVEKIPSTEPEQKWISVTEELPEEKTEVLVSVHFDGTYVDMSSWDYVEVAIYSDGCWMSLSDEYKIGTGNYHHVIAWKPLPEPIKMNNK